MENTKVCFDNPFQITTPEDLSAEEAFSLFVDVFTDFQKVLSPGHIFLSGPRGVGKSMMLRYLQADCQQIKNKCKFSELPFLGIYIPIKNESFVKTELKRLDDRHASEIFNEHLMVSHFCMKIFNSILNEGANEINCKKLYSYYNDSFLEYIQYAGVSLDEIDRNVSDKNNTSAILKKIIKIIEKSYNDASLYARKLSFTLDLPAYYGALFDYQDFLIPVISSLNEIEGMPSKGTIFLLIDDAHFLSEIQTRVLNSWIATRTIRKVSLKVSTQYDYKNHYTVTGATIDTPHDYSDVDMTTVYTSNKANYKNRIREIVKKRLEKAGINSDAESFFPEDTEQEEKIKKLSEKHIKISKNGEGRGYNIYDDAYRYSRPDYIKSLGGQSKSSSTYNYAGFEQLVHVSSGVVRYFLEAAHKMYSQEKSALKEDHAKIEFISPGVQNKVIRDDAYDFLSKELDNYKNETENINETENDYHPNDDIDMLSNLLHGLGGLFRQALLSDRSERRIFSIAISDTPSKKVERILKLGINLGYLQRSTIGKKDRKSGGRTTLYVMNRRLAPCWTLDPTGFAGYLFITNKILEAGIEAPNKMLRGIEKRGIFEDKNIQFEQLKLFNNDDLRPPIEVLGNEGD